MMSLCCDVLKALEGKTLSTAESCTGGMIGSALTAVPGASGVYKGGIISYWSEVKENLLGVDAALLETKGPVSEPVAKAMAEGVRRALCTDVAVSVTGLAGPDADEFGYPVGTVFVGYADAQYSIVKEFHFSGNREQVRKKAAEATLRLILERSMLCRSTDCKK